MTTQRPALTRDLANGIQQQMFFWGRDVMRPEGNFLVHQGFFRSVSLGLKGTSRYRLPWQGGVIELYGACAGWYGKKGGFYFNRPRKRCAVWLPNKVLPVSGEWQPNSMHLTASRAEICRASLNFIDWLISHETAVDENFGVEYRNRNYRDYKKLPKAKAWIPPQAALEWFKCFRDQPDQVERPKQFVQKRYA